MKAALYVRVSHDKQRENFSIATQLEAMRSYVAANDLEVAAENRDDESGAKWRGQRWTNSAVPRNRSSMSSSVTTFDRFGRNLAHQIILAQGLGKHGMTIRYALE